MFPYSSGGQYQPGLRPDFSGRSQYIPSDSNINSPYHPNMGKYHPMIGQHPTISGQYSPMGGQYSPMGGQYPPIQYPPMAGQYPPMTSQHPSMADQYSPVPKQYPPIADQPPPLVDQHSSSMDNKYPPMADQYSPLGNQRPSMGNQRPSMDDQRSLMDDHHPPMAGQYLPMNDQHPPSMDDQYLPMADQYTPIDDQYLPMDGQHSPTNNQHPPMADQYLPIGDQHPPMDGQHSPIDDHHPPSAGQYLPIGNQHPPMDGQHSPHPPMDGQPSTTDDQHPPMADQRTYMADQHPPIDDQSSPKPDHRPPRTGQYPQYPFRSQNSNEQKQSYHQGSQMPIVNKPPGITPHPFSNDQYSQSRSKFPSTPYTLSITPGITSPHLSTNIQNPADGNQNSPVTRQVPKTHNFRSHLSSDQSYHQPKPPLQKVPLFPSKSTYMSASNPNLADIIKSQPRTHPLQQPQSFSSLPQSEKSYYQPVFSEDSNKDTKVLDSGQHSLKPRPLPPVPNKDSLQLDSRQNLADKSHLPKIKSHQYNSNPNFADISQDTNIMTSQLQSPPKFSPHTPVSNQNSADRSHHPSLSSTYSHSYQFPKPNPSLFGGHPPKGLTTNQNPDSSRFSRHQLVRGVLEGQNIQERGSFTFKNPREVPNVDHGSGTYRKPIRSSSKNLSKTPFSTTTSSTTTRFGERRAVRVNPIEGAPAMNTKDAASSHEKKKATNIHDSKYSLEYLNPISISDYYYCASSGSNNFTQFCT